MKASKNADIFLGGSFLILGIILFVISHRAGATVFVLPGDAPPFLVPRIYLYLWIGISGIILAGGLLGRGVPLPSIDLFRLIRVIACVVIGAVMMKLVGFLIAGTLSVCTTCWLLGYRKIPAVLLTGVGSVVAIWFLLSVFANLPLPAMPGVGG